MKTIFARSGYLLKGANYYLSLRALNTKSRNDQLSHCTSKLNKAFYDDVYNIYEKLVTINTFGQHSRWRTLFIKNLGPFENMKILDAAGGTGLTTREILNQTENSNFSIYLCDQNLQMMQIGKNKLEQFQNNKKLVHFVEGDIHNLIFENDTFDLAVFTFSFRTGVNIDQVFKELFRVVKPGGKIGILDFCYSKNPTTVQWLYNIFLDHVYSKIAYLLWKKPEVAYYIADNIRRSPSKDEVVEMLKDAGFHQISTKSYMGGVTYHYIGYKISAN